MQRLTPLWLLKYLPNMLACHVTIIHGLKGPSNTITCGEASSHLAIGEAFRVIQRGDADLAICGGAETKVQPMGVLRQLLLDRLTTQHNEAPADALRPFDDEASGTVVGEGGGLFILEDVQHARARGARIYAEVVGFGATQDIFHLTRPSPSGTPYANAISKALADAQTPSADVDLIIPCGIGIPSHDDAELNGLAEVFGDRLSDVRLAPIKAQIGNLSAGNGVDAAATVLAIHHGVVPPAMNTQRTNRRRLNVHTSARSLPTELAVSSVCSLGGQNAALVFRQFE